MESIRIIDSADQQFGMVMNRHRVTMRVRYNPSNNRWSFDLALDDLPVLHGRKIVTGVDLLRAYHFDIGIMFCVPPGTKNYEPGRNELITGLVKIYTTTEEDLALIFAEEAANA